MRARTSTDPTASTRLLVPLDGSALSENALPLAQQIARASQGTIVLARVHIPGVIGMDAGWLPPHWEAEIRESERDYLQKIGQRASSEARVRVDTVLLDGTPGDAISRLAGKIDATFIVVSTSGRTGLSRAWIGSTADWLVRFAPVPVLLVHQPQADAGPRAWSGRHVLVPLDGSERSEKILPEALRLVRVGEARLTLLSVVAPVVRSLGLHGAPGASLGRDEQRTLALMRETKDSLERLADRLRHDEPELQVETEVIASESVAGAILERARDEGVDTVAMCSRGRGASRLLVGSVADKLLRAFPGVLLLLGPVALREMESDWIVEEEETVVPATKQQGVTAAT